MTNINRIGDHLMIHTRDHKTDYMFDPWEYLGPKRRKLLDNSWASLFREHILSELPVSQLTSYYSEDFGRPTKELYSALGALVIQQMHDLTDDETVAQFSFNLQWHYALDIPGESDEAKYLSAKSLWTLRQRVMETDLDEVLFNITANTLARVFGVDTSKQRIDSVHIRSNMKRLGRICIFSQSIHNFLVNLKRHHREIFDTIDTEMVERYLTKKALGCFSLVKPSESAKTLEQVSKDLFSLVQLFRDNKQITSMNTFGALLRVLTEQCEVREEEENSCQELTLKKPCDIPSSSLQNPSDPDAGYSSHKGQGYHVQVMETYCDCEEGNKREEALNLITHVEVQSADKSDVHALLPALESTHDRGLGPKEVLADSLYGSDENHEKARGMEVDLVAPTMGSAKKDSFSLVDFAQDEKGNIIACPRGYAPVKRRQSKKNLSIGFDSLHCNDCPIQSQCPVKKGKKRHYLRFTFKALRVAGRRAQELTDEFKDKYRWRAGVEATFSEMATITGIKKLRVRGMRAVCFCARLKAVGVNIFRAARVKRAREALEAAPGGALSGIGSLIYAVKEQFLSRWSRLREIFVIGGRMERCSFKIAA